MTVCDGCGMEVLVFQLTRKCPECGVFMCDQCDPGNSCVCVECESEVA